ncbi:MAG: hypothetical protein JXA21_07155 [Anaerolineae bacterium]|nr:hypothetical protein [Anaerolineae bacterium]
MEKRSSTTLSGILISVGVLLLLVNLAGVVFGFRLWQLWPLIVVAAGCCFVLPPLFTRGKPGLGGLFIPGMPILTTGAILLFASVFRWWDVWAWLWPWEVLGVALGFLFAAFYMKSIWLLIPAFIVGANGLLMQFCAFTGWWEVWSVMWVIEPLSLALAFLVINARHPSPGLLHAGTILLVLSVLGFGLSLVAMMLGSGWWIWKWFAPLATIAAGLYLLFRERPYIMRKVEE